MIGRMNALTVLRTAIALEWGVGILSLAFGAMQVPPLPPELQAFMDSDAATSWSVLDSDVVGIGVVLLLINLVASVGLWLRRRGARGPFTVTMILLFIPTFVLGPQVMTGPEAGLAEFSVLAGGFVLALIYYAPIPWLPEAPTAAGET